MGCVPSKGTVSTSPGTQKSEYRHSLTGTASGKTGEDTTNAASLPAQQDANGQVGSNALANAIKPTSLDSPRLNAPADLTTPSISVDFNQTEVTKAAKLTVPVSSALPLQVDTQIDAVNSFPLPQTLSGKPVVLDVTDESLGKREYLSDDLQAVPNPQQQLAATIIQAVYRGRLVRKRRFFQSENDDEDTMETDLPSLVPASHTIDSKKQPTSEAKKPAEEIEIDLNDPDVEKAALKIQGAFRGLRLQRSS